MAAQFSTFSPLLPYCTQRPSRPKELKSERMKMPRGSKRRIYALTLLRKATLKRSCFLGLGLGWLAFRHSPEADRSTLSRRPFSRGIIRRRKCLAWHEENTRFNGVRILLLAILFSFPPMFIMTSLLPLCVYKESVRDSCRR